MKLKRILKRKQYFSIPLKRTITNHFEVKARINGIKGRFILDTGASNSCVDFKAVSVFNLEANDSETKAAGAGAVDMQTRESLNNKIKIGKWKYNNLHLVLFDLTHVNTALTQHKAKPVSGIIGADVLQKGKAIIDYKKNRLYLKKIVFLY